MRQLILMSLMGSFVLLPSVEAIRYRTLYDKDRFQGTDSSANSLRLEEGVGSVQGDEGHKRALPGVIHYPSPADFYLSDPASSFASHMKLLYSGDVKFKDFIWIAPLWERGVVLGLPSLLVVILFCQFMF